MSDDKDWQQYGTNEEADIESDLEQLLSVCRQQGVSQADLNQLLRPFKFMMQEKRSRVSVKTVLIAFLSLLTCLAVLKSGLCDKFLIWCGRSLFVGILPVWDWSVYYNRPCLVQNMLYNPNPLTSEDCELCFNVEDKLSRNESSIEIIEKNLREDVPSLLKTSVSLFFNQVEYRDVKELFETFLSVDDLNMYEACGYSSNTKSKTKTVHNLMYQYTSGQRTQFYAHWENCAYSASKAFRMFYSRPDFVPPYVQLTETNWVMVCLDFKTKLRKPIKLYSSLVLLFVQQGEVLLELIPKQPCQDHCGTIPLRMSAGHVFLITDYLWDLFYVPDCRGSETIMLGVGGQFN